MTICAVDPTSTRRAAFARGFWKGMAAPLMLFSGVDLPAQARPIEYRPLPLRPSQEASDWVRVGEALRAGARRVREEAGG